jgi:hypothetical protein
MKRVWGHVFAGVGVLTGLGAAGVMVSACVHDDSTIFVNDVLAPQFVTPGMSCLFTADPTQTFLSEGTLDADLTPEYQAEFLVGNQMVPRGDPNQPQTETSYVTIQGAVVRIVDPQGKQLNTYTWPTSATIPPSSGTSPGYAPVSVTILDSATVASLGLTPTYAGGQIKRLVSYVRFFGSSVGGQSVESDEFGFPVSVCRSCLISFDNENPDLPEPNCALASSMSTVATSVPCIGGQDFAVSCTSCKGVSACQGVLAGTSIADAGTD